MKYLLYLIVAVSLIACSSTRKSANNQNFLSSPSDTLKTEINYRFIITFISVGAGTDYAAMQKLTEFISQYEQKNALKLNYKITHWGKEGEEDYCFNLSELNEKQQEAFINETKEVLKGSSLVHFNENATCR